MTKPNWTPDRPTQPGEYWLSLHPSMRESLASAPVGLERAVELISFDGHSVKTRIGWMFPIDVFGWLDGALWSVRETPADPFVE